MDEEHIKGAAEKAKGAVKDTAGKMMDDKKLQAEGKMDKVKGAARQAAGDVKDAVRQSDKSRKTALSERSFFCFCAPQDQPGRLVVRV